MSNPRDIDIISFWDSVLAPHLPLLKRGSWSSWKIALKALFALPMTADERALYTRCTGREHPPEEPAREGWFIIGRRGGKSFIMALTAVYLAVVRRYEMAPGERAVVMLLASDRRQARVLRRYVGAYFTNVPMLAGLIDRETKDSVRLSNGIDIEIHTSSFRSVRGYSVAAAVCDELAYWPSDDAANPDQEVINALRPAMSTTGGLLLAISSPYARRGSLHDAYRYDHGREGASRLVWRADTATMNPSVDSEVIARAFEEDAASAWSEYGRDGEIRFRSDIEAFIGLEIVEACTVENRAELPPSPDYFYKAFIDYSGGGGDSHALAIAHPETRDGEHVAVLDLLREVGPREMNTGEVCALFASELRRYGLAEAEADNYAAQWPRDRMREEHGIEVRKCENTKAVLYRESLPMLNTRALELLDVPRLRSQLTCLERRVSRGGRDSVDHPPGQHDDLCNAAIGALVAVAAEGSYDGSWLLNNAAPSGRYLRELEAEVEQLERELGLK